jgi:hypothetical protein
MNRGGAGKGVAAATVVAAPHVEGVIERAVDAAVDVTVMPPEALLLLHMSAKERALWSRLEAVPHSLQQRLAVELADKASRVVPLQASVTISSDRFPTLPPLAPAWYFDLEEQGRGGSARAGLLALAAARYLATVLGAVEGSVDNGPGSGAAL